MRIDMVALKAVMFLGAIVVPAFPGFTVSTFGKDTNSTVAIGQGYNTYTARWNEVDSRTYPRDGKTRYNWADLWPSDEGSKSISKGTVRVPEMLRLVSSSPPRDMVRIAGGGFMMGATRLGVTNLSYECQAHTVGVHTIYMDRYEITRRAWNRVQAWAARHKYSDLVQIRGESSEQDARFSDHPVVKMTWYDCVKWCNARSEKEGLVPAYYTDSSQTEMYRTGIVDLTSLLVDWSADGYRLPTEAEWEKAARGGDTGRNYPWGNTIDGSMANYYGSGDPYDDGTTPVGYYNGSQVIRGSRQGVDMDNGYGLYDMAGNVCEWCWDRFAPVDLSVTDNPRGADVGATRVIRGGSWRHTRLEQLNCSLRYMARPDTRADHIGFRCVRRD